MIDRSRWMVCLILLCQALPLLAAPPVISLVEVSDVTPSSVTLTWNVDQTGVANGLRVYEDATGTVDLTNQFEITDAPLTAGDPTAVDVLTRQASFEQIRQASGAKGIARVRVDGLMPSTTYYLSAVSSNGTEATEVPVSSAVLVNTPSTNSFISRTQVLRLQFDAADTLGWVVIAETEQTQYPVSAVVGDGAANGEAVINLSQMFTAPSANYEPTGQTNVSIRVRDGSGNVQTPSFFVVFEDGFAVALAYTVDIEAPGSLLRMTLPAVLTYTEGEPIILAWVDELPGGSGINLYYDTDRSGRDGQLIVAGIDADADGMGDTFLWETTAVSDGIYWVYAMASDGSTSYAPAPVAVDRAGIDDDGDQVADLWEQLFFGSVVDDGSADSDLDGRPDRKEFEDRTDPFEPDYRLGGVAGLNLVSWPIDPDSVIDSVDVLAALGGAAISIGRLDNLTQLIETTVWEGGMGTGPVFPIKAGEGYLLRLASDSGEVFWGSVGTGPVDLEAGVNLTGFRSVPVGYSAYKLMADLGGESIVSSVGRLDIKTQRFETAAYFEGALIGPDFPVVAGESYLISLRQPVIGFEP